MRDVSPLQSVSKQEKCAAKRQRQYFNRKLSRAKLQEAKSATRLERLEKLLHTASQAILETAAEPPPEEEPWPVCLDMECVPEPPTWKSSQSDGEAEAIFLAEENIFDKKQRSPAEEELRRKVINGEVPTAIADAGASSSVGKPMQTSECGRYQLASDPFKPTGRLSNKIFQYGGGTIAKAKDIRELPYDVRGEAKEVHMVPGTQNNLISTNKFALEDYIKIFDKEEVNVYNANDVIIQTTRGAILRGWRVPSEGLWRFPLVPNAAEICNLNTQTAILKHHPHVVLARKPPPPAEGVNNVYELKTKPQLVRYYHAAAGFPTKPSWLTAIKNGHYRTWPGLDAETAARYFPESDEMWKGHGRKIKSGL